MSKLPKLVRNKIPEQIRARGARPVTRTVAGPELRAALFAKLREEVLELEAEPGVQELADVAEVLDALRKHLGLTRPELMVQVQRKRDQAGGFDLGIILEAIED